MATEVVFDAAIGDRDHEDACLGVRVALIPNQVMLLISRQDRGNDSTFSVNLRCLEEIEMLQNALALAKQVYINKFSSNTN